MLILASRSPRRAELLQAAGIEFRVQAADIDETPRPLEPALAFALRMAREKAEAVPVSQSAPDDIILAADTIVVLEGEIMGKPRDAADATRMLSALSGRRHDVITAICLRSKNGLMVDSATTGVWFVPLSEDEVLGYVASGEPMDKAGAYGIQGLASRFIERIEGSYSNVVGLPVHLVYGHLREAR